MPLHLIYFVDVCDPVVAKTCNLENSQAVQSDMQSESIRNLSLAITDTACRSPLPHLPVATCWFLHFCLSRPSALNFLDWRTKRASFLSKRGGFKSSRQLLGCRGRKWRGGRELFQKAATLLCCAVLRR